MDAAAIRAWDLRARARFTPAEDPPGHDTWLSHAEDVILGRPWSGDCDDLTSTVLDLLGGDGMPLHARFRLLVKSRPTESAPFDHMVGAVVDDAGDFWVVGDPLGGEAYPAEELAYTPFAYQRLDEWASTAPPIPLWRDGLPWRPA